MTVHSPLREDVGRHCREARVPGREHYANVPVPRARPSSRPWLYPGSSVSPEGPGASLPAGAGLLSHKLPRVCLEAACGYSAQVEPCSLRGVSLPLTSSLSSAELLPHLGGLQLQGHEAAFPAEVRLLGVPQMERGWVEERTPHPQTVLLSISPGPLCWLLWPSWMPSRKWLTWPPTPEVGRGHGWRLGMPQVGLGSWKGWVEYEPGKGSQAQSRALEFCSLMKWAFCGESLSSLEACKQEWVKGDRNVTGGVPFSLLDGWLDPSATGVHLPNGESDCGFISPVPICCSGRTQGRRMFPVGLAISFAFWSE